MDVLGFFLLWGGLLGAIAGLLSLVKWRRRGAKLLAAGVLSFAAGVFLPSPETRVSVRTSHLDEFTPAYQWHEVHEIVVAAPRDRIDAAIRDVTPEEIRWYRTLTWLRRAARPSRPGVLNPPPHQPILRMFQIGADEPGREILLVMQAQRGDALSKIGFHFRIEELDPFHCRVITETRIFTRGRHMVRGFGAYWRMIYPGSALIRRSWLRAIKNRAENESNRT
jgi:hypothetical protein